MKNAPLPQKLPAMVKIICKLKIRAFIYKGRHAEAVQKALLFAETKGLDREDCLTLLLTLSVVQEWIENSGRKAKWGRENKEADRLKRNPEDAAIYKKRRSFLTEDHGYKIQTLLMLAFMGRRCTEKVRSAEWAPLTPALCDILPHRKDKDGNCFDDWKHSVPFMEKDRIRQRIRRIKAAYSTEEIQSAAHACFSDAVAMRHDLEAKGYTMRQFCVRPKPHRH